MSFFVFTLEMVFVEEGHSSALGEKNLAWKHKNGDFPNQVIYNYCKKGYKGVVNKFKYILQG